MIYLIRIRGHTVDTKARDKIPFEIELFFFQWMITDYCDRNDLSSHVNWKLFFHFGECDILLRPTTLISGCPVHLIEFILYSRTSGGFEDKHGQAVWSTPVMKLN